MEIITAEKAAFASAAGNRRRDYTSYRQPSQGVGRKLRTFNNPRGGMLAFAINSA